MADEHSRSPFTSFLGTGWSFPPEFVPGTGVRMTADEEDIHASLQILFGTAAGERFLNPKYGLDVRELLFDPISTTMKTFFKDGIRTAILIHEPRINLLSLDLDTSEQYEGKIFLKLEYEVKTTNSRYNMVYPFSMTDGNELQTSAGRL